MTWQDSLYKTGKALSKIRTGRYLPLAKRPTNELVAFAQETMIGSIADGVIILDAQGRVADLNPAARLMLNQTPAETVGKPAALVLSQADWLENWNASAGNSEFITTLGRDQNWYEIRTVPLADRDNRTLGRLIFLRDITEHRRLEQKTEKSQRELDEMHRRQTALDGISLTITPGKSLDELLTQLVRVCAEGLTTNGGASLMLRDGYASSAVTALIGQGLTAPAMDWFEDAPPASAIREPWVVSNVLECATDAGARFQTAGIHAYVLAPLLDGHRVLGTLAVFDGAPHAWSRAEVDFIGTIARRAAALIAQARLFDQIRQLDSVDELTGLFNRRWIFEVGERETLRARQLRRAFAVIVFDLDHFKRLNDVRGVEVGDQVLRAVAQIVRDHIRDVDILGRLEGEEFALLLPETDLAAACHVAERIRKIVAETPIVIQNELVRVTLSLGAAEITPEARRFTDLLNSADSAMVRAKQAGRNRIFFADHSLARHFYFDYLPAG